LNLAKSAKFSRVCSKTPPRQPDAKSVTVRNCCSISTQPDDTRNCPRRAIGQTLLEHPLAPGPRPCSGLTPTVNADPAQLLCVARAMPCPTRSCPAPPKPQANESPPPQRPSVRIQSFNQTYNPIFVYRVICKNFQFLRSVVIEIRDCWQQYHSSAGATDTRYKGMHVVGCRTRGWSLVEASQVVPNRY